MKTVMVKWIDSHEFQGWTFVEDLPKYHPKEITTIGFVVERTDVGIVVAPSISLERDQVCGTMMIPQNAIISVDELSTPND